MNYSEFTNSITKKTEKLIGAESHIYINQVLKNNDTKLDCMVIMGKDRSVAPSIYINDYYEKHKKGKGIDDIVEEIVSVYYASRDSFDLDIEMFKSYDKIKQRIVFKLVSFDKNKELLKRIPYKKYLDLAIVYYILVPDEKGHIATVLIHNDHLDVWKVKAETVAAQADLNTPELLRPTLVPIEKVLEKSSYSMKEKKCKPMGEEDGLYDGFSDCLNGDTKCDSMYVLTNNTGVNGAACLLYKSTLAFLGEKMKRDFYVLPSSVHEVILIPKTCSINKKDLSIMVKDVNMTEVSDDEVLSNSVYEYDCITNKISF